jgi:uncharacterized integral membrane protein (TIGR00697 family)
MQSFLQNSKTNDEIQAPAIDKIYYLISSTFCVIVVLSHIISAKMIVLPSLDFSIPAGLIIYPLTFLLSNLITEFFGAKKAKLMVFTAMAMSVLSFVIIELALWLPANSQNIQDEFENVFGLSRLRIFSSLTAYFLAQIVDIQLYALIKKWTGQRFIWLRNNASTCISQMVDTIAIDIIFLYWGLNMEFKQVVPIMIFSYLYKTLFSFLTTPLLYFCVFIIKKLYIKRTRLVAKNQ